MRNDLTEIVLVVDESTSMGNLTNETISNINKFIEEQQKVDGEATFTLVFFHSVYKVIYDAVDIKKVKLLTKEYKPTGWTALLDALGNTINRIGNRLKDMNESDRPSKVIFAILTDGEENSSREFNHSKIKEMIEHQQTVYSWQFIFMAENINAAQTAHQYGILHSYQNSGGISGYQDTYGSVSACVANYRSTGVVDLDNK